MKDKLTKFIKLISKKSKQFFSNPYFRILIIVDIFLVLLMYVGPGNLIHTHDGNYHMYRLSTSIAAFNDRQPFLQLDPIQVQGFGQAPNLFYGPMLSWLLLIFFKIFGNLQFVLMFLMLIITIATTFGVYFASKKIFNNERVAFFSALIFTLEPFHVGELLTRGSYSEYLAFAFVPFIILPLYNIIYESKVSFKNIFILAFSASGIILNHNLTVILVAGVALLFILFNLKKIIINPKKILSLIFAGILTLMFSAIFILPFLEVKNVGIYNIFNPEFQKLFYRNGSTVSPVDAFLPTNMFSPPLGHASVVFGMSPVVLISIIGFYILKEDFKNDKLKKLSMIFIIISMIFVAFATRFFHFIPLVRSFHDLLQFSQRMLFVPAILLPFVAGYFLGEKLKKKKEILFSVAIILASYLHIIALAIEPGKFSIPMNVGIDYELIGAGSMAMGEYQPIFPQKVKDNSDITGISMNYIQEVIANRGKDVEIISDDGGEVSNFLKSGSSMAVNVSKNEKGMEIEFPMFYYPGFKAHLEGEKVEVGYSEDRRMVLVKLLPGQNGKLFVRYGISNMTKIGFVISAISFIGSGVYLYYEIRKTRK